MEVRPLTETLEYLPTKATENSEKLYAIYVAWRGAPGYKTRAATSADGHDLFFAFCKDAGVAAYRAKNRIPSDCILDRFYVTPVPNPDAAIDEVIS